MKMRIAINTLAMKRELYGVGNYIKNLVWALSGIDRENEYVLFASADNACHLKGLGENFCIEFAPSNRMLRLPWEQSILPLRLKQKQIDVYHGATFVTPLLKTCGHVVSIHDMTFHLVPERHSLYKRLYFRSMIPAAVLRSDKVIAISESAKRDLLRFVTTDEGKINVIHHGVERRFQPVREKGRLDNIREKYGLGRRFILFVGLIEPRKNLENLVDAYVSSGLGEDFDLVLAGNLGWGYSGLLRKIGSSQFRERIHLPGYIADADLPGLFSMAVAFVYPSVYEGFGLPVLEAMACGTPVITSQISSLPEVVGDAAILVDPSDPKALASALQIVLADEHLRKSLSERGIQRAQLFTWEKAAQKTLGVYRGMPGPG
jgi:glycosyltransferase involved in cell wall biosynthesis